MKLLIVSLLLVILIAVSTFANGPYVPLTKEQAKAWWNSQTTEQQLNFIIQSDLIEHSVPDIPQPRYDAILSGRDLHLVPYYSNGLGYDIMALGPWKYHVIWDSPTIKDWYNPPGINKTIIYVAAGSVLIAILVK